MIKSILKIDCSTLQLSMQAKYSRKKKDNQNSFNTNSGIFIQFSLQTLVPMLHVGLTRIVRSLKVLLQVTVSVLTDSYQAVMLLRVVSVSELI